MVWVNATDYTGSGLYTRNWYTFTTRVNLPPVFGTPIPANSSTNNQQNLTWGIPINDPDGNLFSWTIQCSNGQGNNGTGASNGTKTLLVSGLAPLTTYKVWVNATDSTGSGLYTRKWYTFTTRVNLPPVFGVPVPANGSTINQLTFNWRVIIIDPNGDLFSWSIQCSNGQANSATGASNGTKTLSVSGLAPLTSYMVWVNATDYTGSGLYTRKWYSFTTGVNFPPEFGIPVPVNGSTNNSLSLTWGIPINDSDGDLFSWSIQCSNGQANSATGASNGTKTLSVSGLAYLTTYTVWVNASDPTGTGIYTREWYTFTTQENTNLPPDKPERPSGSTSGGIHVEYTYSSSATDMNGDFVWFWFDWGDGSNSGWVGPYVSGTTGSANHTWTEKGSYNITVKAKDTLNAESVWSDPLPISMPLDINYLEDDVTNLNPVTRGSQENTLPIKSPYSTGISSLADPNTRSADHEFTGYPECRNIRELIRLIIRIFRGEYTEMNLIQILRTVSWIR
jgi:hypothetical protein